MGTGLRKIKASNGTSGPGTIPHAVLREYLLWKHQVLIGGDPRVREVSGPCDGVTLADVVTLFLAKQKIRSDKGDIDRSDFRELKLTCKPTVQFLSRSFYSLQRTFETIARRLQAQLVEI